MISQSYAEVAADCRLEAITPGDDIADVVELRERGGVAEARVEVGNPLSDNYGDDDLWYPLSELELTRESEDAAGRLARLHGVLRHKLLPLVGKRVRVGGPGGHRDELIVAVDLGQRWALTRQPLAADGTAAGEVEVLTDGEGIRWEYDGFAVTELP